MMLHRGDMIFYPLHGVGELQSIESRNFSGTTGRYYAIDFHFSRMQLYIPEHRLCHANIRPVSTQDDRDRTRAEFFAAAERLPDNAAIRRSLLRHRLASGSLSDEVQLIRDLVCAEGNQQKLNPQDRSILELAARLLAEELTYIEDISYDWAKQLVREDIELRTAGPPADFPVLY